MCCSGEPGRGTAYSSHLEPLPSLGTLTACLVSGHSLVQRPSACPGLWPQPGTAAVSLPRATAWYSGRQPAPGPQPGTAAVSLSRATAWYSGRQPAPGPQPGTAAVSLPRGHSLVQRPSACPGPQPGTAAVSLPRATAWYSGRQPAPGPQPGTAAVSLPRGHSLVQRPSACPGATIRHNGLSRPSYWFGRAAVPRSANKRSGLLAASRALSWTGGSPTRLSVGKCPADWLKMSRSQRVRRGVHQLVIDDNSAETRLFHCD